MVLRPILTNGLLFSIGTSTQILNVHTANESISQKNTLSRVPAKIFQTHRHSRPARTNKAFFSKDIH